MNWIGCRTVTPVIVVMGVLLGCSAPEGDPTERGPGAEDANPDQSMEDAGGENGAANAGPDVAENDDVGGGDDADAGDDVPQLAGSWVKLVSTSVLTETLVGDEEESKNVSVQRVDIEQEGQQLTFDTEVCSLEIIEEAQLAETTIPDAFVESLDPPRRHGQVVDGQLEIFEEVQVRGVQFDDGEDPRQQPLPTEPDDPRVFDQDGDGNPGVTIEVDATITSGEVYVVQRVVDRFEAPDVDEHEIAGIVDWQEEQEILDASDEELLLAEPQTRPNPDEEASYFRMQKLDDDAPADCQTLADQRDERFDVQAH